MSAKQKIVQGRRPSKINLGNFVCFFDVCRASKPVPSINYMIAMSRYEWYGVMGSLVWDRRVIEIRQVWTRVEYLLPEKK